MPRAARSVHLVYETPPESNLSAFYNELTVTESVPRSFFVACGLPHCYMGLRQGLYEEYRGVRFSVWDGGQNDDSAKVVYCAKDVACERFGGEGTGWKSLFPYPWKIGERCLFRVEMSRGSARTFYAAYFRGAAMRQWEHLATFFRPTARRGEAGRYYSFIEDFRRNGRSFHERRSARFGNGWVRLSDTTWAQLTSAKFTGDTTRAQNIDAGVEGDGFYLATGGETVKHVRLGSILRRPTLTKSPPSVQAYH